MLYERIKLENDEKIIKTVRKHWWIIFTRVSFSIFMMLMPLIGYTLLMAIAPEFLTQKITLFVNETYSTEISFLYCTWVLINWMMLANFWTDHYLDLWTITTRRIVSIDQRAYFHRFLSSFRLERLQDMNIEVKGLIPTLLNFGTIEAQTAGGSNEEFKTKNMPDPRGLKALIIQAADDRQRTIPTSSIAQDGTL